MFILSKKLQLTVLLSIHRERHPDLKDDLRKFKTMLTDSSTELAPLKVWQLQGKFKLQRPLTLLRPPELKGSLHIRSLFRSQTTHSCTCLLMFKLICVFNGKYYITGIHLYEPNKSRNLQCFNVRTIFSLNFMY